MPECNFTFYVLCIDKVVEAKAKLSTANSYDL